MGCVSQGSYPRKSIQREPEKLGSKHTVNFSKGTWHQIKNRERKGPSRGFFPKSAPNERSRCAKNRGKITSRNHAPRTMRPRRSMEFGANIYKLNNADKTTFYTSVEARAMPAQTSTSAEEQEFVVDSGASMHMMSKKDLNLDELDTLRRSSNPTVVVTAKGGRSANKRGSTNTRSRS